MPKFPKFSLLLTSLCMNFDLIRSVLYYKYSPKQKWLQNVLWDLTKIGRAIKKRQTVKHHVGTGCLHCHFYIFLSTTAFFKRHVTSLYTPENTNVSNHLEHDVIFVMVGPKDESNYSNTFPQCVKHHNDSHLTTNCIQAVARKEISWSVIHASAFWLRPQQFPILNTRFTIILHSSRTTKELLI